MPVRLLIFRALSLSLSVAIGLALGELSLRAVTGDAAGTFGTPNPIHDIFHSPRTTVEFGLGYRPILNDGNVGRFGERRVWDERTRSFQPPYGYRKRSGVSRLLFVGDSVTGRGTIVAGLKRLYGEERWEFWNAGVEGYNTAQELAYFRRYNVGLEPDHVILTFHNNDFIATPVVIRNEDGALVSYEPARPVSSLNPWLFQYSLLYRHWIRVRARPRSGLNVEEVETALAGFQQAVEEQRARFTVLLLPILKPLTEWNGYERESRAAALRILTERGIRYFDLLPPLDTALTAGTVMTESPGDTWHPGTAAGNAFASFLNTQGLLESNPGKGRP